MSETGLILGLFAVAIAAILLHHWWAMRRMRARHKAAMAAIAEGSRRRQIDVPPEIAVSGYTCVDCGAPSYAFGHLHDDDTWHDAVPPGARR